MLVCSASLSSLSVLQTFCLVVYLLVCLCLAADSRAVFSDFVPDKSEGETQLFI